MTCGSKKRCSARSSVMVFCFHVIVPVMKNCLILLLAEHLPRLCQQPSNSVVSHSDSHTDFEPNAYDLKETYVESLTESLTEQRFFEDVDYGDAELEEMLWMHTENMSITLSENACLLVSRHRLCPIDQGQPVVERGQELNTEHSQTLLDRQREQILADCQTEIGKHEFQAGYDGRSPKIK